MPRFFASLAIATALLGAGLGAIPTAHAQITSGLAEVGQTVKLSATDPRIIATRIINISLGVLGIILVSLIIYAGFLYMTSGGDAEKVGTAKKIITSAIIGLVIILSSWAIARFVIDRLLQATQGGGGGAGQGGGGLGGGFGGSGGSNAFQVKSISPQGSVPIRNVQVKMIFSRPVDDATASVIAITKDGGTTVAGTVAVNGALVTFTPSSPCPAPNATLFCFDGDSSYTIHIGGSLRSMGGQTIVCGGFAPACQASFHTGNLIDVTPPSVHVTVPLDGQAVPADSLVDLGADATDDSGVSYVEFTENGTLVDQVGPAASSSPLSFSASTQWDTAGAALQSIHEIKAHAFDIDTHDTQSAGVSVVVHSSSCFNGVQDGDETGIDCGGTLNTPGFCGACAGGSCTANNQCASGVCANGTCVDQPIVTAVTPGSGAVGTYVSILGVNFGISGTVVFLGGPGSADDVVALPPPACSALGSLWTPTQVIVAVPVGAAIGPIQITNGASAMTDATNDSRGPAIADFEINDVQVPGLCGVDPKQGYVGDSFQAIGQGFGASPSTMLFGSSILSSFSVWTDDHITTNVPTVGAGKRAVRVKVGNDQSNPVGFSVLSKALAGPPTIALLDPAQGPISEYVTITGSNFGTSVGTVRFKNKTTGQEALADTAFPAACAAGFWGGTKVVVKVPAQLLNSQAVDPGDYSIRLIRSDNVTSNEKDFVVNTATPKPGICAITPSVGPIDTKVSILGERFGATTQGVSFYNAKNAVVPVGNWTSSEVKTAVPKGAETGPVRVMVQNQSSNGVPFEVRNCNEAPDICSQSEQCCANGTCIPQGQSCGALTLSAMYAWQSSTGLIPVAPRVVEECNPSANPEPLPSPAPWVKRAGGDQVCVTATMSMRFTTHLDKATVSQSTFKLKKCTAQGNNPCSTTEAVQLAPGFPDLSPASADQDAVELLPATNLDPSTTYLVQVMTAVKGDGDAGDTMSENADCGAGIAYCYTFQTRASTAPCAVGGVTLMPHPFEVNETNAKIPYKASPLSSDDKCVVLRCDSFDWKWEHGFQDTDGRANFQPLVQKNGKFSCKQTGISLTETGNTPVTMYATALPDDVPGTADLYIRFIPPKVISYEPNCQNSCTNARISALFNTAIDPDSLDDPLTHTSNVVVQPCANENCIESELGMPLPIPETNITLEVAKNDTSGQLRMLRIDPKTTGQQLLLEPGKYYRVLIKGGTDAGIKGLNGVPMTGLNHPDGFIWTFRTKLGDQAYCAVENVDVIPLEKYETIVGARQLFLATGYGSPNDCAAGGQALMQMSPASWAITNPDPQKKVADFLAGGNVDTGGKLPPQCSASCLNLGSQAVFGKVAVCGNGSIETTDANYCKNGTTPFGDACTVLPADSNAGEECDPGAPVSDAGCDAATCLWKPVAQLPNGTCGNGTIETGEACDYGSFCMGASPTSTTPNMTACTQAADKTACLANGGTCAPVPYRGCSAFCRHLGSKSGGSTCGNSDIADGEDCDDGNLASNDGCSNQCLHTGSKPTIVSVCGDAKIGPGESCDKVHVNDPAFPDGCDPKTCLHTGTALCDPNSLNQTNCCDNGAIDAGEDCDDGNANNDDGCSASCLLEGSSVQYQAPSFCSDGDIGTGEQCEAKQGGDGLADATQLAYIVGDADPDQNGKMSSKVTATLDTKSGDATYGLQCGYTDENACTSPDPNVPDSAYGLTAQGCCALRPKLDAHYPDGTGVCRNTAITATFNLPMNTPSVLSGVVVAKSELSGTCPTGTTQVAEDFTPVKPGLFSWATRLWHRVLAWWKADPAIAAVWCTGSVSGAWSPVGSADVKEYAFRLDSALEPNTTYRVKFGRNDQAMKKPISGIVVSNLKSAKGVGAELDTNAQSGPLTFSFETGPDICLVNVVSVTDASKAHPGLFVTPKEDHLFTAEVASLQNGKTVFVSPVSEYSWNWLPWTTSKDDVVTVLNPQPDVTQSTIESRNKAGSAFVVATLKITSDGVSPQSTSGTVIAGTAPVTVLLCENPWPTTSLGSAPFRDYDSAKQGSSLVNSIFQAGPFFNFSMIYCRDAGEFGMTDDIPELQTNFVPPTTTDKNEGVLRQYLFTYGDDHPELKKDGIGIRIVSNPLHYSVEDWYARRGFRGSPKSVLIDGYRAIQDGATLYVAAANTDGAGHKMYTNVYVISHNPDASPVTLGMYDQLVTSLTFNINLQAEVANVCEYDGTNEALTDATNHTLACSADVDCLRLGAGYHCGSFKLKLARDTVRISDFQQMSHAIESSRAANGTYPKLTAGTFLPGMSVSRWPSWDKEFQSAIGMAPPKDPVNQFLTCGQCSKSKAVCGTTDDCPKDETCDGVEWTNLQFTPTAGMEAATCWNAQARTFSCPRYGVAPSRIYMYRSINAGVRYEIASEFEVPKPQSGDWWEPQLMSEVKRCANPETLGYLCTMDSDCRPCANPQDPATCLLPVPNGACRSVGGRYVYQDACTNDLYGQNGKCGDGVLNGPSCSNTGNPCAQDSDCPGGTCKPSETCEIGDTKIASCTTADNQPGLKLQICSECSSFVDEVGVSACSASVACGNGRVDKICSGGARPNLGCLSDADCLGNQNVPAGSCVSSGEICDDGKLNGTYGHCNIACNGYAAFCGDSQISPGEMCDLGNQNGEYCDAQCNLSQTCSVDCKGKAPHCGDGLVTAPEECDGQTQTTQLAICTTGPSQNQPCTTDADCGGIAGACAAANDPLATCQGVTQKRCATSLKECASPTLNTCTGYHPQDQINHKVCQQDSDCAGMPGGNTACRSLQDFCYDCTTDADCSYTPGISGTCNTLPTAHVRTCATPGPDQCTYSTWSSCKITGFCGDGKTDAPGEACDDGASNGDTKACTSSCKKNVCGDGKPLMSVEECDSGSQNGTVTCNADYNSTCQSCSTQCKFLSSSGGYCGDLIKNGPEQCDGMKDVTGIAKQFPLCPDSAHGRPDVVCPFINSACLQSPCRQTTETGVSCQSLGYDFATNGTKPTLVALDPSLAPLDTQNACIPMRSMHKYEIAAYQTCLGMTCSQQSLQFASSTISSNDFWKCVQAKGPALGVGVTTDNSPSAPAMVQCGNACGFSGCGKCGSEIGTGSISGQLVDGVYNQVVPFARVSVYYKGVLVTQVPSDNDGRFIVKGLNERNECGQYKLIVDKYDDNPCTGNVNRPSCDGASAPPWTVTSTIDEGARGGYWPYTSPVFTVGNFAQFVGTPSAGTQRIYLFPRPGPGEAYFSVLWDVDWTGAGSIGWNNNHLILPKDFAYTPPSTEGADQGQFPDAFTPKSCDYDQGPTQDGHMCARDVTSQWRMMGSADMTKLPYAQLVCLHSPGEEVVGRGDQSLNGCPVEGYDACLAAKGGVDPNDECSKGQPENQLLGSACQGGYYDKNGPHPKASCVSNSDCVPSAGTCQTVGNGKQCKNGAFDGESCADNQDCPGGLCKIVGKTCVGGINANDQCTTDADCQEPGGTCAQQYAQLCKTIWWGSCDFYKYGPLTTYFRYSAYSGATEPLKMFWGMADHGKSFWPALNPANAFLLRNFLGSGSGGKKFHAVISTDQKIIELTPPTQDNCGKDCKYWYLGNVNPADGSVSVKNSLEQGRAGTTAGMAIYEPSFQGAYWGDKFCMESNSPNATLIQRCPDQSWANGTSCGPGIGMCYPPTYQQWAKASY